MKMTALAFCHLSRDIKKKEYFRLLRLIRFEPISFRLNCFKSLCFRPFFYKKLPDATNRQIKCRWQEDNKQKSLKKHGQFLFCRHPIIAGNTTWVLEESPGFLKSNTTWVLKESPGFSKDFLASSVSTHL